MRFGLYAPNFGGFGEARAVAELARRAEAAGWDGVFIWDHVARNFETPVVDPWIALSAAACASERMVLGALVTPLARRRPWKLARETASLDRLCDGRLVFGAGLGSAGGSEVEWQAFGEEGDLRVRAELLDEGLEVLTRLWSGEPVRFEGRHHRVESPPFLPTPVQRPRIPVWLAGSWPNRAPFRRAARWDGIFPLFPGDRVLAGGLGDHRDELRDCVDFVRQERGDDAFEVAHLSAPTPGDDPARGAEIAAGFAEVGATWWLERLTPDGFGGRWRGPWPMDAMFARVDQGPPRDESR